MAAEFTTQNKIYILDGIIPRISAFISESLDKEHRIKETLLKAQGEQVLPNLLKEKLNPKEAERLLFYGANAHRLATEQIHEIARLKDTLTLFCHFPK